MKKHLALPIVVLALFGLMAGFASTAQAFPSKTSPCSGCHGGANVPVTATLVSVTPALAIYNVSAPSADALAVFSGSTKVIVFSANSAQFSVAPGKTYNIFAVTGPTTGDGLGSTSVSPVAPVGDTTAPVTTSDAKATYVSSATIKLTATDAGSGVAATYYKLDGGAQVAGTSINTNAVGSHSIEFWSVDVAGNVETHKTATFTITAPPVVDTTAPSTSSDAKATYVSSATIKLTATDAGSGVAATYYKLDGGAQVTGTSISTNAVGAHSLEFWSVDVAGNVETHKTATFSVTAPLPPAPDTTAPATTSDAKVSYNYSAAIHLTATDAGGSGVAHTYYILDSGAQAEGTTINVSTAGAHTIEFWSVDASGNIESPRKNASFEITVPATPPTPVYRFYNNRSHSHFYTTSLAERDNVLAKQSSRYSLDGVAYTVNTLNPDNNAPLYRFYNEKTGSHFYTASEAEKTRIQRTMDDYNYDGPAYNVSLKKVAGATTVYRFYNKSNGTHFYTASEAEKANVQANLSKTYALDGPAYYLAP